MLGIRRGVEKAAEILSQTEELLECFLMMFMFGITLAWSPQLGTVHVT